VRVFTMKINGALMILPSLRPFVRRRKAGVRISG